MQTFSMRSVAYMAAQEVCVAAGAIHNGTYQFISVSRYGPKVHESSCCDTAVKEAKSGLNRYKQLQTGVQLVVYI